MTLEGFIELHTPIIRLTLGNFFRRYNVSKADRDEYDANAFGDVAIKCTGQDLDGLCSSYVRCVVMSSIVDTFYSLKVILERKREPAISENFSDLMGINASNGVNNSRGLSSNTASEDSHLILDLDADDLAAINEFCDRTVTDRLRRAVLRRRVDLILLKLGIDSQDIYEYTSRTRR